VGSGADTRAGECRARAWFLKDGQGTWAGAGPACEGMAPVLVDMLVMEGRAPGFGEVDRGWR